MSSRIRPVAMCCLAVLAAACGPTLDAGGLEEQLRAELSTRFPDGSWQVACPNGVEPDAGSTFMCTATSSNGRSIELEITQGDDQGRVSWRAVGAGG